MIAILGAPGSGKTSLSEDLVKVSLRAGRDARVLDPAGNWPGVGEWPELKDDRRDPEAIGEDWIRAVLRERPRGGMHRPLLIVLEDADVYLSKPPRAIWKRLFATFRHYRVDIVINARRTQDLPLLIFTSATNVYLFRHFVSTDYLREQYGAEARRAIPAEPYHFALFDVETREITAGQTRPRAVQTASDGGAGGDGWF